MTVTAYAVTVSIATSVYVSKHRRTTGKVVPLRVATAVIVIYIHVYACSLALSAGQRTWQSVGGHYLKSSVATVSSCAVFYSSST